MKADTIPGAVITVPAFITSIEETQTVGFVEPPVGSEDWLNQRLSLDRGPITYHMKVMFAGYKGQEPQTIQVPITQEQFLAWNKGLLLHKVDGRFLPIMLQLTLFRPEMPLAVPESA